ncbi:MAG: DUF3316 domain-containing protein [Firmicutes bacterium]|nr:DUF3316 domain-containing protein [Bacillota bacterium]
MSQTEQNEFPRVLNEGTLFGLGTSNVKDTYLSPFNYKGWGMRILNERMKIIPLANYRISRQQLINVDISSTKNPAERINDFAGFVDYSLGYHYRMPVSTNFMIMGGVFGHFLGGFIYNTQNGNNPLSAKIDLDLNLSVIAIYSTRLKDLPLTFRYQADLPVMGVFFAPPYGKTYYEIFNVGHTTDIVSFNSFHNKFAMKNYFTVDIPVKSMTIRAGYLNSLYYSDVNLIKTHLISNSFMIGWVKEFISLGGKRSRHKQKTQSAFYSNGI